MAREENRQTATKLRERRARGQTHSQTEPARGPSVIIMLTSHQLEISKLGRFAARYYPRCGTADTQWVGGPLVANRYV